MPLFLLKGALKILKKRKVYEISIIDKTYSKIISDETKFYTSDTALELAFELKETDYNFESAEIVLLNIDDRSLVTRPVAKVNNDFVYELEDDITAHYGEWRGQLRFEQAGEIYVSSPVKFRIENDLSNDRPPQLSDVQSWVSLKRYADELVEELKQAVLSVEGMDDTFNTNELARQTTFETAEQSRQTTFETNESERDRTFESNETTRQAQELEREEAEATRQQSESQRQLTFETNEIERQNTFETAEQERQRAEIIRIENESKRNLTSVDEFIKLQNAIGGRNYVLNSDFAKGSARWPVSTSRIVIEDNMAKISSGTTIAGLYQSLPSTVEGETYTVSAFVRGAGRLRIGFDGSFGMKDIPSTTDFTRITWTGVRGASSNIVLYTSTASNAIDVKQIQVEKGSVLTDWKLAPEDYTVVSKDDYYDHIKIMSEHRDNQLAELKTAITALGGA